MIRYLLAGLVAALPVVLPAVYVAAQERHRLYLETVSWSFDDLPAFDQYRSAVDP